jgi:hypothetical protein
LNSDECDDDQANAVFMPAIVSPSEFWLKQAAVPKVPSSLCTYSTKRFHVVTA